MADSLSDIFEDREFGNTNLAGADSPENLFDIFDSLENALELLSTPLEDMVFSPKADHMLPLTSQKSNWTSTRHESETDVEGSPAHKKLKKSSSLPSSDQEAAADGQQRASHIMVERNRRKQMNENLSVLRSLMPSFYIKRADQASIIGGVVHFIKELQQVLRSLEEKKQRKVYSDVISPRPVSSPRPSPVLSPRPPPLSPRPPPLSPIIGLPISPRTPQPASPYNPRMQQHSLSSPKATFHESYSFENVKELSANSKSLVADVEVKFAGPNVLLKTTSPRIPGQALKIISALEDLSLEVLHVRINTVEDTMLNTFTIKIGIECELSAEELANEIQQTFC